MSEKWSKKTVAELKTELTQRELSTSGLKKDLVSRLVSDDDNKDSTLSEQAGDGVEDTNDQVTTTLELSQAEDSNTSETEASTLEASEVCTENLEIQDDNITSVGNNQSENNIENEDVNCELTENLASGMDENVNCELAENLASGMDENVNCEVTENLASGMDENVNCELTENLASGLDENEDEDLETVENIVANLLETSNGDVLIDDNALENISDHKPPADMTKQTDDSENVENTEMLVVGNTEMSSKEDNEDEIIKKSVDESENVINDEDNNCDNGSDAVVQEGNSVSMETSANKDNQSEKNKVEYYLKSRTVKEAFDLISTMRTILIHPLKCEHLIMPSVMKWISASKMCSIKKNKKGLMAAELLFSTLNEAKKAFDDMKETLKEQCTVSYPKLRLPKLPKFQKLPVAHGLALDSLLLIDCNHSASYCSYKFPRMVVLHVLSDKINNEEKLLEYFPEAEDFLSLLYDSPTTLDSFAVLLFPSEQEAKEYADTVGNEPVEIEDCYIKVLHWDRYAKEFRLHNKEKRDINQAMVTVMTNFQKVIFDDEKRLSVYREIQDLQKQIEATLEVELHCFDDAVQVKKLRETQIKELFIERNLIYKDTIRRLLSTLLPSLSSSLSSSSSVVNLPEKESDMYDEVKDLLAKKEDGTFIEYVAPFYKGRRLVARSGETQAAQKKKKNKKNQSAPETVIPKMKKEDNAKNVPKEVIDEPYIIINNLPINMKGEVVRRQITQVLNNVGKVASIKFDAKSQKKATLVMKMTSLTDSARNKLDNSDICGKIIQATVEYSKTKANNNQGQAQGVKRKQSEETVDATAPKKLFKPPPPPKTLPNWTDNIKQSRRSKQKQKKQKGPINSLGPRTNSQYNSRGAPVSQHSSSKGLMSQQNGRGAPMSQQNSGGGFMSQQNSGGGFRSPQNSGGGFMSPQNSGGGFMSQQNSREGHMSQHTSGYNSRGGFRSQYNSGTSQYNSSPHFSPYDDVGEPGMHHHFNAPPRPVYNQPPLSYNRASYSGSSKPEYSSGRTRGKKTFKFAFKTA